MTTAARLEALVLARAHTLGKPAAVRELLQPLARYRPADATEAAWRARLEDAVAGLRARGALGEDHRPTAAGAALATAALGGPCPKDWRKLVQRVLPGLGLGLPPDDRHVARITGRDGWAAAIAARALGLWTAGPPPRLDAACDALAWRRLGLPGTPKRCPPEIRARFVQLELASEWGPSDRLLRRYATRAVLAPRPELGALRDALVRCWLAGRPLGAAPDQAGSTGEPEAAAPAAPDQAGSTGEPEAAAPGAFAAAGPTGDAGAAAADDAGAFAAADDAGSAAAADAGSAAAAAAAAGAFAAAVREVAAAARAGVHGDRKVFISAAWQELRRRPAWSALALGDFKRRLVAAHRAGALALARADLVALMDPALVAASETAAGAATFHFIVREVP